MKKIFTNHLINETSAYLLQHAHNPVNWYAWGDEALQKAKEEDKPILVSIGYSACHWCHVMERESFEDEETAALMNSNFINIKVDREERPDLDHIYMDAVQTITGSGGWPLNVFLTPSLKPFYGGTYFPPIQAFNRSSWKQILNAVTNAYQTKKIEIEQQAESLTQHLLNINDFGKPDKTKENNLNDLALVEIANNFLKNADIEWGGFGNAPKFPQTFSISYLLRHFYFTGNEAALNHAILSLDKMMMGGLYDHIGGGFARYSTDKRWQIPHFEKMLYDNALLIDAYTEAYQLTQKKEYENVVEETIYFIKNEMTSSEGAFYSALDADSEGEEGKYYTWSKKEIDDLLGANSEIFCSVYNISEAGNWEQTNIAWMPENLETVGVKSSLNKEELYAQLKEAKQTLFEARRKRVRPLLDTKVLLGWNALMVKSLCKAYAAFGNEEYLNIAKKNIAFIEKNLRGEHELYYHSWNKTINKQQAFLDDYAALIQAYIFMSQVTANTDYLIKAKELNENVINNFNDEEETFFYFTAANQTDVLIRKKELYDGATPSGNSLMAENLILLSLYFNVTKWRARAEKMMKHMNSIVRKYPVSFGYWCLNLQALIQGYKEIVITGEMYVNVLKEILQEYIPDKIIQSSNNENNYWPLLQGKVFSYQTCIYLCEGYKCLNPVKSVKELKERLTKTFLTKNPTQQNN